MAQGLYLAAHLLFLAASLGFVAFDVLFGLLPVVCSEGCRDFSRAAQPSLFIVAMALAGAFVVDGVLYLVALCVHDRRVCGGSLYAGRWREAASTHTTLTSQRRGGLVQHHRQRLVRVCPARSAV